MKREVFSEKLFMVMEHVSLPPETAARMLSAREKEDRILKRKLTTSFAFVLMLALLTTAALAASRLGLLDFLGRFGKEMPQNAAEYVRSQQVSQTQNGFTATLLESYYDGRNLTLLVRVQPPQNTLLLPESACVDAPYMPFLDPTEEEGAETVLDHYRNNGYERAYSVWLQLADEAYCMMDCSGSDQMETDGSVTLMMAMTFEDEQPERALTPRVGLVAYTDLASEQLAEEMDCIDLPVTFRSAAGEPKDGQTLVSAEAVDFPQAGVRVNRVRMERKPLYILVDIYYEITDAEAYHATGDWKWFDLVDSSGEEKELPQAAIGGSCSSGYVDAAGNWLQLGSAPKPGNGQLWRQQCNLAVQCWYDAYALRIRDLDTQESCGTCEVRMIPEE